MLSDQSSQQAADKGTIAKEEATAGMQKQLLYPMPFAVQLQNIFPIEIIARRFPVDAANSPSAQLNASDIRIDPKNLRAQVILEVQVGFSEEPHPFEISFKTVGEFTYTQEYTAEEAHTFLALGSLSVMLPFARELLLSLCTRLQIPPIMLALAQLAPSPPIAETENTPQ